MLSKNKTVSGIFLALLAGWLFGFCKKTTGEAVNESLFLNVRDSVGYVGIATCRSCHANVHETFVRTGMGRSWDLATREKSAATFGKHTVVYDSTNNFYYYPFFRNDSMYVLEYRLEGRDTVHRRLEKISYIVGSGQHTNSHIIDLGGYIYQAPVTYYTQEKRWDLAPGFRENNSRFSRWLTDECITCHNHYPAMVPGSLHKFSRVPAGIECERCHGPGKLHTEEKLKGIVVDTAKQPDYTIVNPRRLPRDLQMDLCQRCHLQGVAVLEEGKTFFDFKPGMRLSEVMNVFLPRFTDTHEKFIMASQADRLRMSACFKNSNELSCLTCHQPHRSVEATPLSQYNNACRKCHAEKSCPDLASPASSQDPLVVGKNCVGCHMPRSGSIDIPHVRITDHKISRLRSTDHLRRNAGEQKAFLGLEILTKEYPTPLDMTKGYLATFEKYLSSPVLLDSAGYYLKNVDQANGEGFKAGIHYLFLREDYRAIINRAAKLPAANVPDGWTAYRIGEAFFKRGEYQPALDYFTKACEFFPYHLDFLEKRGTALLGLNRLQEASVIFGQVLAENPKRPVALCNLGYVEVLGGKFDEGLELYDLAIALNPDYEQALLNKAAVLILTKKKDAAKRLLQRVLKINPDNPQALAAMGRVL
jgi:predicted CXXCH cytochrome family protein